MIRKISISVLAVCAVIVSSCKLDLLDNPNAVTTSNTDINYLLNSIELSYKDHFNQMSDPGLRLTRMLNQGSAIYDNAVSPGNFDNAWTTAYAGLMTDVKTILPLAESSELFVHAGIARTLRASVLLNLVDAFGDVPYTQAIDAANFNPGLDTGESTYAVALSELDKAIANFAATSKAGPGNDLFYANNVDNWTRAANTLKLKAYLNRRLIDKAGATTAINGLIAGGKLIATATQNFTFKFGSNLTNPDTRHNRYANQYASTGGGDYQSNAYMGALYSAKGFQDPRIRFYFYRQTVKNPTDVNALPCVTSVKPAHYADADVFCLPSSVGYWGRDHLNNAGIPPDGLLRTAWGLYPAGGLYDNDAGVPVSLGAGAGGAGIHPVMMRSFVDFMLAESVLTLGTTGVARDLLKSAVEKSMADVRTFALGTIEGAKISTFEAATNFVWADQVTRYINKVLADYDAAATTDAKLNIVATEYWLSLHGNGIEAYNLYRRTGKPANLQPALDPNAGSFPRSYYYPSTYITRNATAKQKASLTTPVFWDNNVTGLLK